MIPRVSLSSIWIVALLGCFPFSGGGHHLDGPYYLMASDISTDMSLTYEVGGGYVQRVPSTVFAAGWNSGYIVVKRHPGNDRRRTQYYILDRHKDTPIADPSASVAGPLTAQQFAAQQPRLGRIEFQLTLHNLE